MNSQQRTIHSIYSYQQHGSQQYILAKAKQWPGACIYALKCICSDIYTQRTPEYLTLPSILQKEYIKLHVGHTFIKRRPYNINCSLVPTRLREWAASFFRHERPCVTQGPQEGFYLPIRWCNVGVEDRPLHLYFMTDDSPDLRLDVKELLLKICIGDLPSFRPTL